MAKRRGNNEGTIYQKSTGKWRAQVSVQGKRLNFIGETRMECQVWIKETTRKIDDGLTYKGSKTTLEQFILEWLTMKSTTLQPETYRQYKHFALDYIIPELGNVKLIHMRADHIQSMYNKFIENGVGPRSIEYTHSVLRGCLNHAVKVNLLSKNPANGANPPKPKPEEIVVLNESQIQSFMIAAQSLQPEHYALYQLALTTGMRIGEILGLKWEDFDWYRRNLTVRRQLKRDPKKGFYFSSPKSKAGIRTIKLGEGIVRTMRSHYQLKIQQQPDFLPEWREANLAFSREDGSPIQYRWFYIGYKKLLKAAGLPDMTFHGLRHTAATQMLVNGVDILTVSKRIGHSKPSVTLDIYGHMITGPQDKAAALMDEITTPITMETLKTAPKLHPDCTHFVKE